MDTVTTDGFYIKHKSRDEAIEFIDLVVANGYELFEGVVRHHNSNRKTEPTDWSYVGIRGKEGTFFTDNKSGFGKNAKEMTLQQVRDMFNKDDKWINGIPPVGCECEHFNEDVGEREKCIIVAHDNGMAVFKCTHEKGDCYGADDKGFRPLKSQQDKEGEDVINEMLKLDNVDHLPTAWKKAFCKKLIDEGYRKINPISDEDIEGRISSMIVSNDSYVRGIRTGIKWAIATMLGKNNK